MGRRVGRWHVLVCALGVEIKAHASCRTRGKWAQVNRTTTMAAGEGDANRVVGALCQSVFVIDGRGSR